MREILFRGKEVRKGKWIEGYYCHYDDIKDSGKDDCDYIVEKHNGEYFPFKEVITETVGQYTGLTDKNGKKIFEGDILQGTITSRWNKSLIRCEIVYKGDCFLAIEKISNTLWEHKVRFSKDIEVIGNIHDNPELLKELQNGNND